MKGIIHIGLVPTFSVVTILPAVLKHVLSIVKLCSYLNVWYGHLVCNGTNLILNKCPSLGLYRDQSL